jgi:hypothetical protein
VDRIVQKALSVDREQRYESALDMQADLEAAIARLQQRASEREIGEMISNLFAQERRTIASVVEQQVALLDATNSEEFAMHSLPALHTAAGVMSMTPILKDTTSSPVVASEWSLKSGSTHRRRTILVLLAVFGVLATFAIWGVSQSGSDRPAPSAASLAAKAPASPVTALPEAARPAMSAPRAPSSVSDPAPGATPTTRATSSLALLPGVTSPATTPVTPPLRRAGGPPRSPPVNVEPSAPPPPAGPSPAPASPPPARTPSAATYGPLDDRH